MWPNLIRMMDPDGSQYKVAIQIQDDVLAQPEGALIVFRIAFCLGKMFMSMFRMAFCFGKCTCLCPGWHFASENAYFYVPDGILPWKNAYFYVPDGIVH